MAQYISKDALLAEIERRIKTNKECMLGLRNFNYYKGKVDALNDTISFLDTLEVKEVDLDKEIDKWWWGRTWQTYGMALNPDNIRDFAKYFVELGLKAQRKSISIQNIDDVLKELGVDPHSKEAKMIKESYYAAIDKLQSQKGD